MSTKYKVKYFDWVSSTEECVNEWIAKHCRKVINVSVSTHSDFSRLVVILYIPKRKK